MRQSVIRCTMYPNTKLMKLLLLFLGIRTSATPDTKKKTHQKTTLNMRPKNSSSNAAAQGNKERGTTDQYTISTI